MRGIMIVVFGFRMSVQRHKDEAQSECYCSLTEGREARQTGMEASVDVNWARNLSIISGIKFGKIIQFYIIVLLCDLGGNNEARSIIGLAFAGINNRRAVL